MTGAQIDQDSAGQDGADLPLIGHELAIRQFLQAWRKGRLHHCWLLTGPDGIGKSSMALQMARFLLIHNQAGHHQIPAQEQLLSDEKPDQSIDLLTDPNHPVARRIKARTHSGFFAIKAPKASEIQVQAVREALNFTKMKAGEADLRVMLVHGADRMTRSASNALLKFLEEPGQDCYVILVADRLGLVPATVRSRCRILAMHPLTVAQSDFVLQKLLPDLIACKRTVLATLGSGSPGVAMDCYHAGALALYERMLGLLQTMPDLDPAKLIALTDSLKGPQNVEAHLTARRMVARWLGLIMRCASGASQANVAFEGEGDLITKQAAKAPLEQWLGLWEKSTQALDDQTGDRKLAWINLFLEWCELLKHDPAGSTRTILKAS
ncbi:MAG: DNA polymerase III subunit delta' [Pseudomonadota bacterium]